MEESPFVSMTLALRYLHVRILSLFPTVTALFNKQFFSLQHVWHRFLSLHAFLKSLNIKWIDFFSWFLKTLDLTSKEWEAFQIRDEMFSRTKKRIQIALDWSLVPENLHQNSAYLYNPIRLLYVKCLVDHERLAPKGNGFPVTFMLKCPTLYIYIVINMASTINLFFIHNGLDSVPA